MSQTESISFRTSPWTLLGFICLAATLLLTSFGVTAVRADDAAPLVSEAPPAASCSAAQAKPPVTPVSIQQQIVSPDRVAMNVDEANGAFLMLNNRGYNYGPAMGSPEREQQLLDREVGGR